MSSDASCWNNVLLLVTGASRGFGRAVAVEWVSQMAARHLAGKSTLSLSTSVSSSTREGENNKNSNGDDNIHRDETRGNTDKAPTTTTPKVTVVLLARSKEGLEATAQLIEEAAGTAVQCQVELCRIDMGALDTGGNWEHDCDAILRRCAEAATNGPYDCAILINNAASLGDLGEIKDMTETTTGSALQRLRKSMDLNVASCIHFTSRFVSLFDSSKGNKRALACRVVNISSLCAVKPFPTMGQYCVGKAARDMFHCVLAKENSGPESRLRVLNFAPGVLETEMQHKLSHEENHKLDPSLQSFYRTAREEGHLIAPQQSAGQLVKLILEDTFESGAHVDYWDVVAS